jgi:very-short-patch-repair endonuclease
MPLASKKKIIELCRDLRKNCTDAERLLWANVRNRKLAGRKFYRQHPIVYRSENDLQYFFIVDFYCDERKLIVEIDGKVHDYQKEYDLGREDVLKELGLGIVRFTNDEVSKNISGVLKRLREELDE